MNGAILYTCGHEIWDADNPQDMEWKSEVECPSCRNLSGTETLSDAGVFDLEREQRGPR